MTSEKRRRPSTAPLEEAFGVPFDPVLLERALTHRSYAYENGGLPTNERLEFLGDSVLGVVITSALFDNHPELPEGQLAKLRASVVNMHALADVARALGPGVPDYVIDDAGPDHAKTFTAWVVVAGERYGGSDGRSKKQAAQRAAAAAWRILSERPTAGPPPPPGSGGGARG